jgi:hypothetical protein
MLLVDMARHSALTWRARTRTEVPMVVKRWLRVVVLPLVVTAVGCSLDEPPPIKPDSRTPSTPSDASLVLGAPAPGPSPSASPTATPESATPSAGPCTLPTSNPESPVCTSDPGHLLGPVEAAIKAVTQSRPALFDFVDKRCDDCYRVLDVSGYFSAVQAELAARGICTFSDTEEISAKDSNKSSEQFDILLASGHIRRGPGVYRGICYPAIF